MADENLDIEEPGEQQEPSFGEEREEFLRERAKKSLKKEVGDIARQRVAQPAKEGVKKGAQVAGQAAKKAAQAAAKLAAQAAARIGAALAAGGPAVWIAVGVIVLCFLILGITFVMAAKPTGGTPVQPVVLSNQADIDELLKLIDKIGADLSVSQDVYEQDVKALIVKIDELKGTNSLPPQLQTQYTQLKEKAETLLNYSIQTQQNEIKGALQYIKTNGIDFINATYESRYGQGVPGLKAYVELNKKAGGQIAMPGPNSQFNSKRSPNQWRKNAGLHNGYDFGGGVDTPVVAGWDGKIVGISSVKGWIIDSGDFTVSYIHISRDTNLKVGQNVKAGDIIGWINSEPEHPHVDIKMKRKSDDKYVDWGKSPWEVRSGDNNATPTTPWVR